MIRTLSACILAFTLGFAPALPATKARPRPERVSPPPPAGGPVELRPRKIIRVGAWPKGVELTPDQKYALTTNFSGNSVSVIDTATLEVVKTVSTGKSSPVEVAWFPDGKRALLTGGWERNELLVLDLEKWEIARRIEGQTRGDWRKRRVFPKVPVFSPGGERLYVSYWSSDNVAVYDAGSLELMGLVPAGVNPRGVAITPDGAKGYICNFDKKGMSVTVFKADAPPFKVLKTIRPLPNPRHVVISKDGRFAYVALFGGAGGVAKIDVATDTVVARSAPTGRRGKTVKLSPDGRWLFLTNFGADTVSVFDAESLAEVARARTGREPCGLDVSADGKTLWTTDWKDNRVRVWDIEAKPPADEVVKK